MKQACIRLNATHSPRRPWFFIEYKAASAFVACNAKTIHLGPRAHSIKPRLMSRIGDYGRSSGSSSVRVLLRVIRGCPVLSMNTCLTLHCKYIYSARLLYNSLTHSTSTRCPTRRNIVRISLLLDRHTMRQTVLHRRTNKDTQQIPFVIHHHPFHTGTDLPLGMTTRNRIPATKHRNTTHMDSRLVLPKRHLIPTLRPQNTRFLSAACHRTVAAAHAPAGLCKALLAQAPKTCSTHLPPPSRVLRRVSSRTLPSRRASRSAWAKGWTADSRCFPRRPRCSRTRS